MLLFRGAPLAENLLGFVKAAGAICALLPMVCACDSEAITLGYGEPDETGFIPDPSGKGSGGGGTVVCETSSKTTTLRPAYLALAFDVSGSMGRLDCPFWNHDPELKWKPVVAATTAFLEDEANMGIHVAMTLFPAAAEQCEIESYATPDVPLTELPSTAFREALVEYEEEVGLDAYTDPMPEGGGQWRGGTPTFAAVAGTRALLEPLVLENEGARFAIVLVTDGMPAGCRDDVEHLADVIATVSDARAEGILTYVIGVREPELAQGAVAPWEEDDARVWACHSNSSGNWLWEYDDPATPRPPPDNLANLHTIAAAGGTGRALLIDTGDPDGTRAAFQTAVSDIRREAVPCSVELPPHPDGSGYFDKDKIDVRWVDGDTTERLPYDPACDPGGGWHYDDDSAPTAIELCAETCTAVQASPTLELRVDFLCEQREPTLK